MQRNTSLDAIAGLFIIMMMFIHFNILSIQPYSLGSFFVFYMPWFFFKSGMFYKEQKDIKNNIRKCLRKFAVPYFVFAIFGLSLQFLGLVLTGDSTSKLFYSTIAQYVLNGFAWNNIPLWFLFALFFVRVLSPFICRKRTWICWVILFLIVAYWHEETFHEHFTYIGTISLGSFFYILGWRLKNFQFENYILGIGLLVYALLFLFYPSYLNFFSNSMEYGNWFVSVLGSIAGIVMINNLFARFSCLSSSSSSILTYFGRESMTYLVMHVPIFLLLRHVLTVDSYYINWVCGIVALFFCFLAETFLIKKYNLNILIGK